MQALEQSRKRDYSRVHFPYFYMVLLIPTVGTLLQLFWLNYFLAQQTFRIATLANLFLYFMNVLCYVRSITITNQPIQAKPPKQGPFPPWLPEVYRRDKRCDKESEQLWKPPRTSHCHLCGCVLRMDHHCIWINQCVGINNHRSFILFSIYAFLIALQYQIVSFNFYWYHWTPGMSVWLLGVWVLWMGLGVFLLIMLGMLISFQAFLIGSNTTQIQLLKSNQRSPFAIQILNIYDLGIVSNFVQFFDADLFFFWWPKSKSLLFDGCDFPKIPPVTREEVNKLPEEQRRQLRWNYKHGSLEQAVKEAKAKYAGQLLSFQGQIYKVQENE